MQVGLPQLCIRKQALPEVHELIGKCFLDAFLIAQFQTADLQRHRAMIIAAIGKEEFSHGRFPFASLDGIEPFFIQCIELDQKTIGGFALQDFPIRIGFAVRSRYRDIAIKRRNRKAGKRTGRLIRHLVFLSLLFAACLGFQHPFHQIVRLLHAIEQDLRIGLHVLKFLFGKQRIPGIIIAQLAGFHEELRTHLLTDWIESLFPGVFPHAMVKVFIIGLNASDGSAVIKE